MLGYLNKNSFKIDELLEIRVHSINQYSIHIFPVFNKNAIIFNKDNLLSQEQNIIDESFNRDKKWDISCSVRLTNDFKEKIYIIDIYDKNDHFYIPFYIIHNNNLTNLVISNTNTWAAYNYYGGGSFYNILKNYKSYYDNDGIIKRDNNGNSITKNEVLFCKRPNPTISKEIEYFLNNFDNWANGIGNSKEILCEQLSHLFNGELYLYYWLNKQNIDYTIYTDIDFLLEDTNKFKNIIIHCHPEYWSEKMYFKLLNHYNYNKSIINLGGNSIYYRVNIDLNNYTISKDGNIQSPSLNVNLILNQEKNNDSYSWCMKKCNYLYPHELLNVLFDSIGSYGSDKNIVIDKDSWIFENTSLKNGDTFGLNIIPLESDKSYNQKFIVARGGEAKHDFIVKNITENTYVISTGSITWTHSLLTCKNTSKILKNIFNKIK